MENTDSFRKLRLAANQFAKEKEYWITKFSGTFEKSRFPYDLYRKETDPKAKNRDTIDFSFSEELSVKLSKLSNASDARLHMILVTGITVLLYHYTNDQDIIVGMPIYKQDVEGDFINTELALRNRLDDNMTFKDVLLQVRQTIVEAVEHQNYPIETLVYQLDMQSSENDFPLFDIAILLENIQEKKYLQSSRPNMIISFSSMHQYLGGTVEYNSSRYTNTTIQRIISHLMRVMEDVLGNIDIRIRDINLLSKEEEHRILCDFNDTAMDYPQDKTIVDLFEEQALRTTDNIAVVYEDRQLTYQELNARANQVAHVLRTDYHLQPEDRVGVLLERSEWLLISLLGILKAGGVYVPIDTVHPPARIKYILKDSGCNILLTEQQSQENIKQFPVNHVIDLPHLTGTSASNPVPVITPESLAYIIYTSGSTGQPKGCMNVHRGFVNMSLAQIRGFDVSASDRVLQFASSSFDASISEIFMALFIGAALVIADRNRIGTSETFTLYLQEHAVTVATLPPVYLHTLDRFALNTLNTIITAGEPAIPDDAMFFSQDKQYFNAYGPSEAAVCITFHQVAPDRDYQNGIPIGKPISNMSIFILNKALRPVSYGIPGEICVSGVGVGRGYINRSDLTDERFVPHPFHETDRLYRTGDLGYWLPDGNIEFLGRYDDQVKIRGYRIELGEIEQRLLEHEVVKEAVVVAKDFSGTGDKELAAYVVFSKQSSLTSIQSSVSSIQSSANSNQSSMNTEHRSLDTEHWSLDTEHWSLITELREHLKHTLPDYMLPAYFVQLDSIPLTPNGKINKRALPDPRETDLARGAEYLAPRDEAEQRLAQIWQTVLQIPEIGIRDNFFDLGGHSLKATRVVSHVQKELNVEMSLRTFFRHPTIEEQAEHLREQASSAFISIKKVPEADYYPVSHAQRRLWVLDRFEGGSTAYNIPESLKVETGDSKLDIQALEQAIKALIQRHESLRTIFLTIDEKPIQKILESIDFNLDVVDLTHEADPEVCAKEFARKDALKPFDLSAGPLIRASLLKIKASLLEEGGGEVYILLFNMHHIISDGWSITILVQEFCQLYDYCHSTIRNPQSAIEYPLSPLRIQYKDYAVWQNRLLENETIQVHRSYWHEKLAGEISALDLPADFPRPSVQTFRGNTLTFNIDPGTLDRLHSFNRERTVSLFMTIIAIVKVLLYRYTGQEDIIVGSPIAGRNHADLEGQIGFYVNTLALRDLVRGSDSFDEFLQQVKETATEAYDHQIYPFDRLVEELNLHRDISRFPLFDVMVILQNNEDVELAVEGVRIFPFDCEHHTSKFDLLLNFQEAKDSLRMEIEYNTDLFREDRIRRMGAHLTTLLNSILNHPEQQINRLNILSESEQQQLLVEFQDNAVVYVRDKTIIDVFEEQVEKTPDNIAVVCEHKQWTFGELNERANQLAHFLRDTYHIQPDDRIGLFVERSEWMMVGMLGILKAGGAYVPIDADYPKERILRIIENSGVAILLTSPQYIDVCDEMQWEVRSFTSYISLGPRRETAFHLLEHESKVLWNYVAENASNEYAASGWINSYTGEVFAEDEMREFVNNVVTKLTPLLDPEKKVLEIGCGSGMIMFALAPFVERYYGTDLSENVLRQCQERIDKEHLENIELHCLTANEIDRLDSLTFDVIIVNSVIQYFPSYRYLREFLSKALDRLSEKGILFIGDVREKALQMQYYRSLFPGTENIEGAITERKRREEELFLAREFFRDSFTSSSFGSEITFSKKTGTIQNELSLYRYDVLIHINKSLSHKQNITQRFKQQLMYDVDNTFSKQNLSLSLKNHHLAYVIYTSGSTGIPKGVMLSHQNVVAFQANMKAIFRCNASDRIYALTTVCFDISVLELLNSLMTGMTVVMSPDADIQAPEEILRVMETQKISVLQVTPSRLKLLLEGRESTVLESLKVLLIGGEALPDDLFERLTLLLNRVELFNVYGPTEATIWSTCKRLNDGILNIGEPLLNESVYILSHDHSLVPIGVVGEICIGGEGLARGYYKQPEMTSGRFIPHPFREGARLYKTGDLGRWLPDGTLECLGRNDDQVKIRGYRIELEEIEHRLLQHEAVKEAVVVAKDFTDSGQRELAAYVVQNTALKMRNEDFTINTLREYLKETLPDYMIPAYFMEIQTIPLTPNGKIDRKLLPDPLGAGMEQGTEYEAPRNDTESLLSSVWTAVLGRDKISIHDNYFALGGDSIKAIQVISRLNQRGLKLKLDDLFQYPAIAELAVRVPSLVPKTEEQKVEGDVPLTAMQKWFFQEFGAKGSHFHQTVMLTPSHLHRGELQGEEPQVKMFRFDDQALQQALQAIQEHHDTLRLTYTISEDGVIQRYTDSTLPLHFDMVDLRTTTQGEERKAQDERNYSSTGSPQPSIMNRQAVLQKHATGLQAGMNLAQGSLMRTALCRFDDGDWLLIAIHHLVVDGVSWRILLGDLNTAYSQLLDHRSLQLSPKTASFKTWAEKIDEYSRSETLEQEKAYWNHVTSLPIISLPPDFKSGENMMGSDSRHAKTISIKYSKEESEVLLNKVHQAYTTRLDDVLLTGLVEALRNWTGCRQHFILLEGHDRESVIENIDVSRTVGWFTGMYPVLLEMPDTKDSGQQLKAIKEILRKVPNQGIGYGILRYIVEDNDLNQGGWPEISYNYLGQFDGDEAECFSFTAETSGQMVNPLYKGQHALDVSAIVLEERLSLSVMYDSTRFKEATIRRFTEDYQKILRTLVEHCLSREIVEKTPGDFTYSDFAVEDIMEALQ